MSQDSQPRSRRRPGRAASPDGWTPFTAGLTVALRAQLADVASGLCLSQGETLRRALALGLPELERTALQETRPHAT